MLEKCKAFRKLGGRFGLFLAAALWAHVAGAQEHILWIGFDADPADATGCGIETADAATPDPGDPERIAGLDGYVEIRVDPTPADGSATPAVTGMWAAECDRFTDPADPNWAAPRRLEGASADWALSMDAGLASADVVEALIPASALPTGVLSADVKTRVALWSRSVMGYRDHLDADDSTLHSHELFYAPEPTFGGMAIFVCFLALALSGRRGRVRISRSALSWVGLWAASLAQISWAIGLSIDGQLVSWSESEQIATDASQDSEAGDPSSDLIAFYASALEDGSGLVVRIDVYDLEHDVGCGHLGDSSACTEIVADPLSSDLISTAVTALGDSKNPDENLLEDARIVLRAGSYRETERILVKADGTWIVAEDGVIIHNQLDEFFELEVVPEGGGDPLPPWEEWDVSRNLYRSVNTYFTVGQDMTRAWGSFVLSEADSGSGVAAEERMLVSYPCYGAIASETFLNYEDSSCKSNEDPATSCDENTTTCPFVGPGIFWDQSSGHLYARLLSGSSTGGEPRPLEDLLASNASWLVDSNPNHVPMKVTLDGPWLQLDGSRVHVGNLEMELGSVRMGGGSTRNELSHVALEGPAAESPIEIYSGGSHHVFDHLVLDQKFPEWLTWDDTKQVYTGSLQYAAITLNHQGSEAEDVIHHLELRDSTIQNAHDGLELNLDAYRHLLIHGNRFIDIQDDAVQLGSSSHDVEIAYNEMLQVGTGVSRHAVGANDQPGRKFIHHNFIDASSQKYYCRLDSASSFSSSCDEDGKNTLRGFGLHGAVDNQSDWGEDGDARHYYNNTVLVNGEIIGVGLHGQKSNENELPFWRPSLVLNNVFIQTDSAAAVISQSPKWVTVAPPVLIMDGNYYYRPPASAGEPTPAGPFEMSGNRCGFEDFKAQQCKNYGNQPVEDGTHWDSALGEAFFSWGIEDHGIFDDANLSMGSDFAAYAPDACWIAGEVAAADLTALAESYQVSTSLDPAPLSDLSLPVWLPGADGNYRGHIEPDCAQSTP